MNTSQSYGAGSYSPNNPSFAVTLTAPHEVTIKEDAIKPLTFLQQNLELVTDFYTGKVKLQDYLNALNQQFAVTSVQWEANSLDSVTLLRALTPSPFEKDACFWALLLSGSDKVGQVVGLVPLNWFQGEEELKEEGTPYLPVSYVDLRNLVYNAISLGANHVVLMSPRNVVNMDFKRSEMKAIRNWIVQTLENVQVFFVDWFVFTLEENWSYELEESVEEQGAINLGQVTYGVSYAEFDRHFVDFTPSQLLTA